MEEHTHKHVTENPDSIEIGTPSKGGACKVYGNFSDLEAFERKIDNAKKLREYANVTMQVG